QPAATSLSLWDYVSHLVERLVVFGVPVASMAGAYYLLKSPVSAARLVVDNANDVAEWVRKRWAVQGALVIALGMLFLFLHLELNRSMGFLFAPGRMPVLSLLWLGMCLIFLHEYRAAASQPMLALLGIFSAGALIKLAVYDLDSWELAETMVYGGGYS